MTDDKTITQADIDDASVKLKPLFGVPPVRYLPIFYGLAIAAILFLVFVLPGLKNPGSEYSFTVDPPGSAVFVDGAYRDSSPCATFVKSGLRTVRIERPGFASYEAVIDVRARVIGTVFGKSKVALSVSLSPKDGASILRDAVPAFSAWALSGSPSDAYQIPLVLSDAARAASIRPDTEASRGLAGAALSYSTDAPSARDALRSAAIAYSGSAALGPATLGRFVSAALSEIAADPAMLAAFVSIASPSVMAAIEKTPFYRSAVADSAASIALASAPRPVSRSAVAGEEFVAFPAGTARIDADSAFSAAVPVPAFSIAASETTVGRFKLFVAANPEWNGASAARLAGDNLAEKEYLTAFDDAQDDEPVRFVSKRAAEAYCSWLSAKAPAGYRFSLPSEAQWAYAAAASGASASKGAILLDSGRGGPLTTSLLPYDAAGLKGMLGNVWEWCSDSFAAHPAAGRIGREVFRSAESVVRGGSWANKRDFVSLSSRGPMNDARCTAYLGFRVALVKNAE